MMFYDHPACTIPSIYKCKSGLHNRSVFEGKRIATGVDRHLIKNSYVWFINSTGRLLCHEISEIVFNFFVIVTHLIGRSREQDGIAFIKRYHFFRIVCLESVIPLIEKCHDFVLVQMQSQFCITPNLHLLRRICVQAFDYILNSSHIANTERDRDKRHNALISRRRRKPTRNFRRSVDGPVFNDPTRSEAFPDC